MSAINFRAKDPPTYGMLRISIFRTAKGRGREPWLEADCNTSPLFPPCLENGGNRSSFLSDGKHTTWSLQQHESQISEIPSRLISAGNRIKSIHQRLLLLGEVKISSAAAACPLLSTVHTPLHAYTEIASSGLPEVNLTLLFFQCIVWSVLHPISAHAAIASRPYLPPPPQPSSLHPACTHTLIQ